MDHPFYGPRGRRAILPEIEDLIARRTGTTPVGGFAGILDPGDAVTGDSHPFPYMETGDPREWILHLNTKEGLSWRTNPVPAGSLPKVSFVLAIGFGNGHPFPQPTGSWDVFVNDRLAVTIRTVNHSQQWRGNECLLTFSANRIETAAPYCGMYLSSSIQNESCACMGPALLTVPMSWLGSGEPATIRVAPQTNPFSKRWFGMIPPSGPLHATDIYPVVRALSEGPHPEVEDYRLFFGDIHTHSGEVEGVYEDRGCGTATCEDNYLYAKGPGGLDFYCLSDHEWQIGRKVDQFFAHADRHNEDGRFVCLPGYEYTNLLYGHRNVYFRESGGIVFDSGQTLDPEKTTTPEQLWAALEAYGEPCITVPHHTSATSHPLNLDFYNPKFDRLMEVYSTWGSSAYYGDFPRGDSDRFRTGDLRDAIRRGRRYGIIASSDSHDGHPGNGQGRPARSIYMSRFCNSGRAVVFAHELTRGAVFDALYERRCYATTGTPIVLDVRVNGAMMGTEQPSLAAGKRPEISVRCNGSNGIDHVRIVKNGRIVHTAFCHGEFTCDLQWEDDRYDSRIPASYYVRMVQIDRESAWSSPVWIG